MTERAGSLGDHGNETEERGEEVRESAPLPERVADDVPEADAIEQAQPVDDEPTTAAEELDEVDLEVPEGDAIEQAVSVPPEDERR